MPFSAGISLRGQAGAQLVYGDGPPSNAVGNNNDTYIDRQSLNLYPQKQNGVWPSSYLALKGAKGDVGSSWTAGFGAPPTGYGLDNDYYLNLSNAQLLRKVQGAWPSNGTVLYNTVFYSSTVPDNANGNTNDTAFVASGSNILLYQKQTNVGWVSIGSLTGQQGIQGPKGNAGADGLRGTQFVQGTAEPGIEYMQIGDFYFRTTTQNLYQKVTNAIVAVTAAYPNGWQIIANLQGLQGIQGIQGLQGPAGASLLTTVGAPSASMGVTNSFAIDPQQAFLYGPKDATNGWNTTSPIHLIGPRGPAGATTQQAHNMGTFWCTGGDCPSDYAPFGRAILEYQNGNNAGMDATVPIMSAGSVRSIYGWVNGPVYGTVTMCLFINGQPSAATATYSQSNAGIWEAEFASGAVTVNKLDYVQLYLKGDNSGIDQSFSGFMNLETAS